MSRANSFLSYFKAWVPEKPFVVDTAKNYIHISWRIEDEKVKLVENYLLYKIQTHDKLRGWFDVYCGGKQSKIIDNLNPSRPHKFRLKVLIRPSAIVTIHNDISLIKALGPSPDTRTHENSCEQKLEDLREKYAGGDVGEVESEDNVNYDGANQNQSVIRDGAVKCVESRWSEELPTCTKSEGPSVLCFYMAVRCGYLKQVQQMLEERPNLISICNNTDGFTPLATAIRKERSWSTFCNKISGNHNPPSRHHQRILIFASGLQLINDAKLSEYYLINCV